MTTPRILLALGLLLPAAVIGCESTPDPAADAIGRDRPDYGRELAPGQAPLRLVVEPRRLPDLRAAWRNRDVLLTTAIERSIEWFDAPSSRSHFPHGEFTHAQVQQSVIELKRLLEESPSAIAFERAVLERFDVWESVGWNGRGEVLFTGYYSPEFPASLVRTERFSHPLHRRPADLVTDAASGRPLGRRTANGDVVPYWTRRDIEERRVLEGGELVWLEDDLSAFLVHVNGSAKLRLPNGEVMFVGYDGKTDRPYASLGQAMIRDGLVRAENISVPAIRQVHHRRPEAVRPLMWENESYVFFTEYGGGDWPSGSLGVPVTARSTIATDKRIFPRGAPVLVETRRNTFSGGLTNFTRICMDQDTGGAIKAPGRADIYMGEGAAAGILAGLQHAEGRMCYLILKRPLVERNAIVMGE